MNNRFCHHGLDDLYFRNGLSISAIDRIRANHSDSFKSGLGPMYILDVSEKVLAMNGIAAKTSSVVPTYLSDIIAEDAELTRARHFFLGQRLNNIVFLTANSKVPGGYFLSNIVGEPNAGERSGLFALIAASIYASDDCRVRFKDRYGLTRAEAEVAFLIADGISPEQIASARGTSLGTVRTQIKMLKQKLAAPSIHAITRLVLGYSAVDQKLEQEWRRREAGETRSPDSAR